MSEKASSSDLTTRIQELLNRRQEHADAIAGIDQTLAQIGKLLGSPAPQAKAAGKPKPTPAAALKPAAPKPQPKPRSFAVTAPQSLLSFVAARGNPTTQEIQLHWKGEGRTGQLSPILGKLVMSGKLKRTAIPGQRGSRYSLATPASAKPPAPTAAAPKPKPAAAGQAISGRDFILRFVREQENPTTAQIEARWKAARRPGRANKTLGRLVDGGKLKREKIKGGKGSRYSLA